MTPAEDKKLYARAHQAIEDLLPALKGEKLTREQWYRLLNIPLNSEKFVPFKNAVNAVLWNLSQVNKKKKIVKEGSYFKVVQDDLVPIDFMGAKGSKFDLILPFNLHEYCFLYRKNIMVIFGSKDAGKTALLLNIIKLNMNQHRILFFSSEMVEDEMKVRLLKDDSLRLQDWHFEPYERSYDFDQVIDPDALNIIDFLELGGEESEYYKGVSLVRKIYDKLDQGVAIIAVQKNRHAELPKGGSGLLEKARIALSLDPNKATLTIAKNWADGVTMTPRGKKWRFQLVGGIKIVNVEDDFSSE